MGLLADAEEADEDFGADGEGEADGEADEDDVGDVGEDVAQDDADIGVAEDLRGLDVGEVAVAGDFGADVAADADPGGEANAEVDAEEALPDDHGDREDEEESGHGGDCGAGP